MMASRVRTLKGMPPLFTYWVIVQYEAKALARSIVDLISHLVVSPLTYLLLLGAGVSGISGSVGGGLGQSFQDRLTFIIPGVLMLQALGALSAMTFRYQVDRQWGMLALKLVQGVSPTVYVTGMNTIPALQFIAQLVVVIAASMVLGVSIGFGQLTHLLIGGLIAVVAWASVGGILVLTIKKQANRMVIVRLLSLPLVFAAPTFYSMDGMPAYMRAIAIFNPVTYQVEMMRGGSPIGGIAPWVVSLALTTLAVASLVALVVKSEPLPTND